MEDKIRINKFLANQKIASRREVDALIEKGLVFIDGRRARLGDKVGSKNIVEIKQKEKKKKLVYYSFNKPSGIVTHSARSDEKEIKDLVSIPDIFPLGRLDKESHGLILLTNDGRVTGSLLNPDQNHEKEYLVRVKSNLRPSFKMHMERGVDIGDVITKPCRVEILGDKVFKIILTEGKKHQIRRMCVAMHQEVEDLKRTRILNIKLGNLKTGTLKEIQGKELAMFLKHIGL